MVHKTKKKGFYIIVKDEYGEKHKKNFTSIKALKDAIDFDGQAFWLGSERLGEIAPELQWNWDKLTPKLINKEKDVYVDYLSETGRIK
jgi:hypothetical protein